MGTDVLTQVQAAGITLVINGGNLVASPRSAITDELRGLIRLNKSALMEALARPDPLPPLSPAAEVRRQKVLAMLARDGGQYATLVGTPTQIRWSWRWPPRRDVRRTHPQGPLRPVRGAGKGAGMGGVSESSLNHEANTMTQFYTGSPAADDEAAWLRGELQAAGVDPAAIDEAIEAHRKGMSAYLRWEADDFGLAKA